jgi:DNA-directed RNA polymerase specialized sigma subunit
VESKTVESAGQNNMPINVTKTRVLPVSRRRNKISNTVRDQIVLDHLKLVKAIAVRVHENLPVHVDLDDLVHAGVMGLFDAANKYNPLSRNCSSVSGIGCWFGSSA